jgi:hypothetical protein
MISVVKNIYVENEGSSAEDQSQSVLDSLSQDTPGTSQTIQVSIFRAYILLHIFA